MDLRKHVTLVPLPGFRDTRRYWQLLHGGTRLQPASIPKPSYLRNALSLVNLILALNSVIVHFAH